MKNDKLMILATVASFGLLYVMVFVPIPEKNVQVFVFLLGLVCGFFFGGAIKQATPPGTVSTTSTPIVDVQKGVNDEKIPNSTSSAS